ncbi:MAG TPA: TolC family protein [Vicinamibacterales bacterium]
MATLRTWACAWACAAACALLPGPARAQQTPLPSSVAPMPLTLDEAVQRALERNLDIAVERLEPQTHDLTLAGLRAEYLPLLTANISDRSQLNPPTSQLNGGQRVLNDTLTYNTGVSQALPWGGGSVSVSWNNNRTDTTNVFANYNPSYVSQLSASIVQPLTRGLRIDETRQRIRITQINRAISESQLRATITNTLAAVRNAYWDYVHAVDAVGVAQRSLDLAKKLVEDNRIRVEAGALAPIDILQAEAEAASRQQALAQAEAAAAVAELALKQLIVDGPEDPLWRTRIDPIDRPPFVPVPIDTEAAVRRALAERTDLEQARRQLEANEVTLAYLRDLSLPAVDLVGSYSLQGLGGTQFIRQGSGLGSSIIGTIPGGFRDALASIRGAEFPTWSVGVTVSYPLLGSQAEANHARARVQRLQTQAQIKALELQVAADVTSAALQVQSNQRRVEAAATARALAERRLEAEQSRFEVGLSTNFFVVQAQRDLADAQNAELRALLDYHKSLVEFERAQETALSNAGITVISAGSR